MADSPELIAAASRCGVGYIALWPPVECGCGRMAAFAVNRLGKTRCVECDAAVSRVSPGRTEGEGTNNG